MQMRLYPKMKFFDVAFGFIKISVDFATLPPQGLVSYLLLFSFVSVLAVQMAESALVIINICLYTSCAYSICSEILNFYENTVTDPELNSGGHPVRLNIHHWSCCAK
jgi:hypothetical protein